MQRGRQEQDKGKGRVRGGGVGRGGGGCEGGERRGKGKAPPAARVLGSCYVLNDLRTVMTS